MKQSAHGEKDGTFFETDFSRDRVDSSKNTPIIYCDCVIGMWNIGGALTLLIVR